MSTQEAIIQVPPTRSLESSAWNPESKNGATYREYILQRITMVVFTLEPK